MAGLPDRRGTIALIGARCAGKSSVGERLARRLDRPFVDLDEALARASADGRSPLRTAGELLRELGEPAFREFEARALERALGGAPACVLATGGGCVERERSRTLLRERATCIWLRADAEVLGRRLTADPTDRPPLEGADAVAELAGVLARREPLYAELADLVVETEGLDLEEVVGVVLVELARRRG